MNERDYNLGKIHVRLHWDSTHPHRKIRVFHICWGRYYLRLGKS